MEYTNVNKKEYTINDEMEFTVNSEDDLMEKYNKITEKHLKIRSVILDLSEYELFVYIAGKTYKRNENFSDSVSNARYHIRGRRRAERFFNHIDNTLLTY